MVSRVQSDPAYRRTAFLRGAVIAIGGVTLISAILAILAFVFAPDLADGIAFAGVVLTGATLLLAVIAAAVAVLAYAVTTGTPVLAFAIKFPFSEINNPTFEAQRREDGNLKAVSFKQLTGEIHLRNDSQYSARNPAVIIRLKGMAILPGNISKGWVAIQFANTIGVTAIQWDGEPAHPIHGNSTRRLPDISLDGLTTLPAPTPYLEIEILAEGYRKTLAIKPGFKIDAIVVIPPEKYDTLQMWL
jgi:hypothetical protein